MNNRHKFSKGDWQACCLDRNPHYVFAADGKVVAGIEVNDPIMCNFEELQGVVPFEEARANARLIQAAPDLLVALGNLSEWVGKISGEQLLSLNLGFPPFDAAYAAIEKAL